MQVTLIPPFERFLLIFKDDGSIKIAALIDIFILPVLVPAKFHGPVTIIHAWNL